MVKVPMALGTGNGRLFPKRRQRRQRQFQVQWQPQCQFESG